MFRFRAINKHLLDSLVNSKIYFAEPTCLNDPFDCRVEVLKSLDNAIIKSSPENRETLKKLRQMPGFFEKVQADISQVGVCSFSLELTNPLMWSHYADQHRGLSLMESRRVRLARLQVALLWKSTPKPVGYKSCR